MNEQLLLEILTDFATHLVDGPPKKMRKIAKKWLEDNRDTLVTKATWEQFESPAWDNPAY